MDRRETAGPADRDPKTDRRGLYVVTIRSDRATFGALFDQADSTAPVDRRTSSTVAPQALYLMNHPFAIEQAEGLAARLTAEGADDRDRIDRAYRLLYARPPTADELAVGDAVTATLPWLPYARIDLLPTPSGPAVLELELVEPSAFLRVAPGAEHTAAKVFAAL